MLQVVLIENDIDSRPFTSQVLACLPPLPWSVSSEHLQNPSREDLRHIRVFSVDPPGMWRRKRFFFLCFPSHLFLILYDMYIIVFWIFMILVVAGCKDIDDALHCTALPSGNFEVGVRIL